MLSRYFFLSLLLSSFFLSFFCAVCMAVCPKFSVSDPSWEISVQEYGRALSNNASNNTTFPLLSLNAYQMKRFITIHFN
ncbi:hypothetical protein IMY05_C0948000100 [Salix suchowensis]|nr:hypothetical protein IMY05_C0948000100 [Salix suchowensis]